MASENVHHFGNIMLGGRGGTNSGQLKINSGGFIWKKTGGGKVVEVSKADVSSLSWTRVPRGYQLGVRLKAGSNVKFNGFKEQDVSTLSSFMSINLGVVPEDKPLSVSGRNWGQADLIGNMLSFEVGDKQAFELSLADVSQTQLQGKNDVLLEFHVDDTTGANEKDCLMEMSFHVPTTNTTYVGDDNNPPAQVFCDKILSMADVVSSAAEAVAVFREVTILTPRGRYSVELHLSFLRLQGQANDFKIQYTSVVRLFVLPKSNQPHTFVVISLDPPIRKGQTFYPHIVLQFSTDDTLELDLTISEDLLTAKYNDRLQATYQGLEVEVFAQVLRGLSGAKVTRPGKFRSSQDGYAVRASLKTEDGGLYPLEKGFFFLPKPPTLILHDEVGLVKSPALLASRLALKRLAMASENVHHFGNIMLGGRGGTNSGQLKINSGGFIWKKTGGGKVVEVSKADVSSLSWTRVPRGYQLGVRLKAGSNVKFNGFKEQDVSTLSSFMSINLGVVPEDKPLSVSGRNWGQADLIGNMLSFEVGDKQAFELSLADVSQTQLQGKNDVLLEFHVDDTTGANEKDCLMEMSFHVPTTNTTYVGDDNNPPAQVFCDKILSMADVVSSAAEAVAVFREVTILTPRGRYSVELHLSFLRLQGQANDFKIQYTSVVRLFVLPKSNQPHTFVVISLDPPIRKGQTFYPHIVLQFSTDDTLELDLTISEDLLTAKYNDRLQATYQGLEVEVFAQVLRGLSGAKVTRPGKFRSSQDGYAVRASLKTEDGGLYPLEKGFFFLPKPPTLILHDEVGLVKSPALLASSWFKVTVGT
ncbi:hypothetical protein L7F22_040908 [Adiantum nelumboides]|nr:hypothetical protein [Adiantum nelumboides]